MSQSSSPICAKCQKTMKFMLAKGEHQRVLRCTDCGQPDPMHTAETNGWLNGELREKK
jgi:DNA-directed RNA polymerase subunit RPC12/RpoP